jgi:hypothetical protein
VKGILALISSGNTNWSMRSDGAEAAAVDGRRRLSPSSFENLFFNSSSALDRADSISDMAKTLTQKNKKKEKEPA